MKELLDKYGIGQTLYMTKTQVEEWESLSSKQSLKFLQVHPKEDEINYKLWENGLEYSRYHKSYIGINPYSLYKTGDGVLGKVQSFKIRLSIENLALVEQIIFELYNVTLSRNGSVVQLNQHEIRIYKEIVNNSIYLNVFGTENYNLKNPKFWISETYSKDLFNKSVDPSFFSLQDAIQYSIQEVFRRSSGGRYDASEDALVTLDNDIVSVSVTSQMEESKRYYRFELLIKKC